MAWWIDTSGFKKDLEALHTLEESEKNAFVVLARAARKAFYRNLVDLIYAALTAITYTYFFANVISFFFQPVLSPNITYFVTALSEPYLGALGIYIIVVEVRRRRNNLAHPRLATVFAGGWLAFLIASTCATYFSKIYHFDEMYRTVVTNSLAALIIRLGTILSRIPIE